MKARIQQLLITAPPGDRFCLFCGKKICGESSIAKKPCGHVLFISTSEGGFEYCRPDLKPTLGDNGDWETLSKLPMPNDMLVNESQGPPSCIEFYIGLSPKTP